MRLQSALTPTQLNAANFVLAVVAYRQNCGAYDSRKVSDDPTGDGYLRYNGEMISMGDLFPAALMFAQEVIDQRAHNHHTHVVEEARQAILELLTVG